MRQVLADALLPCPPLGPRWIGGFAFTHKYLSDRVWQAFDPACFVLPHFQLERYGDRFFATINVLADSQDNPQAVQRYSAEALRHFTEELNAREVQEAPVSPGAPERADIEIREPVPKENLGTVRGQNSCPDTARIGAQSGVGPDPGAAPCPGL